MQDPEHLCQGWWRGHGRADCLAQYLRRGDSDQEKLVSYAEQLGNGTLV